MVSQFHFVSNHYAGRPKAKYDRPIMPYFGVGPVASINYSVTNRGIACRSKQILEYLGTYPQSSPIWFSDSDDTFVTQIFRELQAVEPSNYTIDRQVKILVTELCRYKNLPIPPELTNLCPDFNPEPLPVDSISTVEPHQVSPNDGNSDAEDTGFEDDAILNDPFEVS
ncbi:ubiquitin-conjugating enzyme E2 Q [Schistosoma japonicum]|nr:ubiquitin-conjugating enzyme E2 Q [Schistosoma japonicum]